MRVETSDGESYSGMTPAEVVRAMHARARFDADVDLLGYCGRVAARVGSFGHPIEIKATEPDRACVELLSGLESAGLIRFVSPALC